MLLSMTKKTFVIFDSTSYAKSNCFIHQLRKSILQLNADIKFLSWSHIRTIPAKQIQKFLINNAKHIVLILKQRTVFSDFDRIHDLFRDQLITVYDQDPWNAYWDDYSTKGIYSLISENLNVSKLAVPSLFWRNYIAQRESLKVVFVRMGMLPEYSQVGTEYNHRDHEIEFVGSLHEHRLDIFRRLADLDVEVVVKSGTLSYPKYLNYLSNLRIFLHDESAPLICEGVEIPRSNGMWHKDIESASRGCFVIRDSNFESEAYDISDIPTIYTYQSISEVPSILKEIRSIGVAEREELRKIAVERIRTRNDWKHTASALLQT